MSTKKKSSSKKKTTLDYWGDEAEPQYTEEQKKRIASYLKENDENCKESTTLILIIVIGLLVALSIVGFLAIRNHSSITYKGSHTTYEHASSNTSLLDEVWSKWNWLQSLYFGLNLNSTNSTRDSTEIQAIVALEEELNDFQPIYRNPLLQRLYAANDEECNDLSDDSLYNFISIRHGSWVPSKQYLEEALDFSWTDFESKAEKEEIASVQELNKDDITDKDRKNKQELKKQFETKDKQKKRRLLALNVKFDPAHAMPNPANILDPKSKANIGKKPKNLLPLLPFGNKQHVKHLDTVRNKHKDQRKTPQDILKHLDLSKYGIDHPINDETDKEKRADLAKLEEQESKRHPFMTLLTNPGHIDDVKCMKKSHRTHSVVFKANANADESTQTDVSVFNYDSNVLLWYCYLIQIESDAINDLNGGGFKVNLTFVDVNMEVGFDYINIYINSMLNESVSGIGLNWETDEASPQFVYYMDSDYIERYGNALEICMKIVTDSSIIKQGFKSVLNVDYDDPQITKWSAWSECTTKKVWHYKGSRNDKHWNGGCGIGVKSKSVTECMDPIELEITDSAPCNVGERITEYCVKANCFDFPMTVDPEHPIQAFKFNGHGRVDPDFPDPFVVMRSRQESYNINDIIQELSMVRDQIISRYPDERALSSAAGRHQYTAQSNLRLGIRLVRSLLLGDTFTVYMTGSSNTAGHENMFMSSWPMQFQSMMRPVWKRVGYKGAAFVVKNHAEGGGLGTMELGPCIPSLIGDDADVVWWESRMNDHGDAVDHAVENHFRNAITLPRRPLYHIMTAGKNGPYHPGTWETDGYSGSPWVIDPNKGLLQEAYNDYGSGITTFYPTGGLAGLNKTKYEEFQTGYLYISWHPGPPGHRVYAEQLAYHYLTRALETFADIKDLIDDLTPDNQDMNKPIEEMLEILEDPPRLKQLPHDSVAGRCDPVCTNATEAVCIAGYKTLGKPRFRLKRWRQKDNHNEDTGQWEYDFWMRNPESFLLKDGGLGSCDIKEQWSTKSKDSNELRIIFEAKQYGFVNVEAHGLVEAVKAKKIEIKINEIDMKTGKVSSNPTYKEHGKALQCIEKEAATVWLAKYLGCNFGGLQPYQKYELVVNLVADGECHVKNIRVY